MNPLRHNFASVALFVFACMAPAWAEPACIPHVEENARWQHAKLRSDRDGLNGCTVSAAAYQRVLREWIMARDDGVGPVKSVALGRAVRYRWIRVHLAKAARAAAGWDSVTGSPRSGRVNAFVAALLSEPAFLERLDRPFRESAYTVASVSVEKVLVGRAGQVLPGGEDEEARLPHDAQLWLVLEPRP